MATRRFPILCALFLLSVTPALSQGDSKPAPIKPAPPAPQGPGPDVFQGKEFPAFTMKGIDGKTYTSESLRGKVLLIDFWATWCGPCKKASPIMQALHDKYSSKGLVVIGANCSERGPDKQLLNSPEPATKYAGEHKYTYLFTYGNDELKKAVNIRGIPTMFIVDKNGIVKLVQVGFYPNLQELLEAPIVSALGS